MGERTDVVTAFLESEGQILVAQRSNEVRTYPGHWAGISGYLEVSDPLQQAYVEIREETGLVSAQARLVKQGEPVEVDDPERDLHWRVYPFRFRVDDPEQIKIDWEHQRFRWIHPEELDSLQTVPALKKAWERVQFDDELHG